MALGGKRPIIRLFTGGRKAVNIEILMRKLPADVAQAIAELDTVALQVRWWLPNCLLANANAARPLASVIQAFS